jgi:hypothetical protein
MRRVVAVALITPDRTGRMSANGLRFGSGITVGLLGAVLGVHWSLGLSAAALCLGTLVAGAYALGTRSSTVEVS